MSAPKRRCPKCKAERLKYSQRGALWCPVCGFEEDHIDHSDAETRATLNHGKPPAPIPGGTK